MHKMAAAFPRSMHWSHASRLVAGARVFRQSCPASEFFSPRPQPKLLQPLLGRTRVTSTAPCMRPACSSFFAKFRSEAQCAFPEAAPHGSLFSLLNSQAIPSASAAKLVSIPVPANSSSSSPRNSSLHSRASVTAMAGGVTSLQEMSKDGAFVRTPSSFRDHITNDGSSKYPAVAGRYHLYISYACPWACRCYAVLKLKGLDDAISVTVVKPKWERTREGEEHFGWAFAKEPGEEPDSNPDPIMGAKFIRDVYEKADPNSKKFSVPVLWDKETGTIVNNESSEILRMFNSQFNHLAKNPDLDIYPEDLRADIDAINEWVYPTINNGVYRCGFATKQAPYNQAFKELFEHLDKCEEILSKQRYMAGDRFTEADIRLWVTLIRFDEVYVVHFKCNKKMIKDYPNLFNYVKDIYQLPNMACTVNMYHIKKHYYGSHPSINPFGIIPGGPAIDYTQPHDRDRFSSLKRKTVEE